MAQPRMRLVVLFSLLLLAASPARAQQHFMLIVSGIGGLQEYQTRFDRNSQNLYQAALKAGFETDNLYLLSPTQLDGHALPHRVSNLAGIEAALGEIKNSAGPGDRVFVVLIGHGNPRGDSAVFNLPGPDLSAASLAARLEDFSEQILVIVNSASASGPFVKALARKNSIVITATSSGREYHSVSFGDYFVDAFAGAGADRDKDERISILEAFDFARREVRRHYESDKRLLTEHALLDDNGDGIGSLEPGEFEIDGALANRIYLQPPWRSSGSGAGISAMLQRKSELELSISALKRRRDEISKLAYYDQLELLLVDLALLTREIQARGGS